MRRTLCALAALAALPLALAAQDRQAPIPPPPLWVDLALDGGQASGEFARHVDNAFGGRLGFRWRPAGGAFGLRLNVTYHVYGSVTNRYGLLPGVDVDVTTTNSIVGMTLGPTLTLGTGTLQPYASAGVGFSYFFTESHAEGTSTGSQPFARTTNFDDWTVSADGGAGLYIMLSRRWTPVALDVGARFAHNSEVRYVTKDGMTFTGTSLIVSPEQSRADLVVYHLGVTIGLRKEPGGRKID